MRALWIAGPAKRSAVAKDLKTPKYRSKVVPDKRKALLRDSCRKWRMK